MTVPKVKGEWRRASQIIKKTDFPVGPGQEGEVDSRGQPVTQLHGPPHSSVTR